ncbi:hypothetical protein Tsubulata_022459, partial [Turnera subulata]
VIRVTNNPADQLVEYIKAYQGDCNAVGGPDAKKPADSEFADTFAPNCGVSASSLSQITGRLLGCQSEYLEPAEAFSEILMRNQKGLDILYSKNHTEVGAAVSGSDGGSPYFWCVLFSNGKSNSSFAVEGGEAKVSRPGCFSGANDECSAASEWARPLWLYVATTLVAVAYAFDVIRVTNNPADQLVEVLNKNRTAHKASSLYDNQGLACIALQYIKAYQGDCNAVGGPDAKKPADSEFADTFAPNCGVSASSLSQITGRLLGCQSEYLEPAEAFSEILMRNQKGLDILYSKNHTEVGAAVSGSDGGSPYFWCVLFSNGKSNSSFAVEGGEAKVSRPGCFSGANDECSAASEWARPLWLYVATTLVAARPQRKRKIWAENARERGREIGETTMDLPEEEENSIFDLNVPAEESCSSGRGFRFPADQTETVCVDGGESRRRERESPDVEIVDCPPRKRIKYTVEEKGKAKIDWASESDKRKGRGLVLGSNLDMNVIDLSSDSDHDHDVVNAGGIDLSSMGGHGGEFLRLGPAMECDLFPVNVEPQNASGIDVLKEWNERRLEERKMQALSTVMTNKHKRKEEATEQRRLAREVARRFAHLDPEEKQQEDERGQVKRRKLSADFSEELSGGDGDGDADDLGSLFSLALEEIRKREKGRRRLDSLFKWVPADKNGSNVARKRNPPRLLDLSLSALAKNADAIVSLDSVPDMLRSRLSQLVCDSRKGDAHFIKLLASDSPTEIRVKDTSQLTEEEFANIFGDCDTRELNLDLCGRCMPDYVLPDTLTRSSNKLAALSTISLRGAHRLSDTGLASLAMSAPALQSVNLGQCSLLTSHGIIDLSSHLNSTLTELYIDDCQNVDSMSILPALKKLERLEVLSVSGISTVSDEFVIELVKTCGVNMRGLVFANCKRLTDTSIKMVGKFCPKLCALDLCYLDKLTDSALKYLANGCQSIHTLKLCRNGFRMRKG